MRKISPAPASKSKTPTPPRAAAAAIRFQWCSGFTSWFISGRWLPFLTVPLIPCLLISHIVPVWEWLSTDVFYNASQAYRYPYLLTLFRNSLLAGTIYPRWMPELGGGYGIPTFIYYPPGFWYAAFPFSLVLSAHNAFYVTVFLILALGGAGMYKLTRLYANRWIACAAVVLFYTFPYLLKIIFRGGVYGQITAAMLIPWVLFFTLRLAVLLEDNKLKFRHCLGWILSVTALLYAHSIMAIWASIVLGIILSWWMVISTKRRLICRYLCAMTLITLAMTSPHWLPFITMAHEVHLQNLAFSEFKGPPIPKLLSGISLSWKLILLITIIALPLAVISAYSSKHVLDRLMMPIVASFILLMAYITQEFGSSLRANLQLLLYTQQPKRVFSIISILMILMIAYTVTFFSNRSPPRHRNILPAAVCILVAIYALDSLSHIRVSKRFVYADYVRERMSSWEDMTHAAEFTPRRARRRAKGKHLLIRNGNLPLIQAECGEPILLWSTPQNEPYLMHTTAKVLQDNNFNDAPCVLINQWYMKGWRVQVNGRDLAPVEATPLTDEAFLTIDKFGRMMIMLPQQGVYEIQAWFDGPPYWRERNALAALCILGGGFYLWCLTRRSLQHAGAKELIPHHA